MKKKGKFSEDEAIVLYAGLEVHDGDCSKVLTDPDFSMPLAGRDVSSLRRKVRSDSRKLHEAQQALHAAQQQQQQVFQQSLHEAQLQFGALNLGEKYSFVHQPIVRHPKPQHLEHIQFHDWYHEDGLPHPLVNVKNNQGLEEPPKDFHDNDLQDYLNDLELQRQNAGSGSNGAQLQPAGGVDPSNNEEPMLQLHRQNAGSGSGSNGVQLQPAGGVDPSNNGERLLQLKNATMEQLPPAGGIKNGEHLQQDGGGLVDLFLKTVHTLFNWLMSKFWN